MRLARIVGCEHRILGVIGSIQFKLASFDGVDIVEEMELEVLGNDTDTSMQCTSFRLDSDDFVSEVEVNYADE